MKFGRTGWSVAEKVTKLGSWWVFGAIAAIGVVPWFLAWYLVDHPGLVGKPGNHGMLIDPPRQVDYALFQPASELPSRPLKEIRGRWVIVHFVPKDCARACQETLVNTHKLHLLLNKDIPRVRRLAVWSQTASPGSETLMFLGKDNDLYFATVSPAFLERLEREVAKVSLQGEQVILMDPLGNLMMWYDSKFDPYGLYRDLKRLLNASRIG